VRPIAAAVAAVLVASVILVFPIVSGGGAAPARAESNQGLAFASPTDNLFYAYVRAGEVLDVRFSKAATNPPNPAQDLRYTVVDAGGATLWTCTIPAASPIGTACATAALTGTPGAWRVTIENLPQNGSEDSAWNITVRVGAGGAAIPGRVWAPQTYNISQSTNSVNLEYWAVNDTGYIYHVEFDNYWGIYSAIIATASGNTAGGGSCVPLYESRPIVNGTLPRSCSPYRIFFQQPAADLPATSPSADGTLQVLPPLLNLADVDSTDMAFAPNATTPLIAKDGTFSYSFTPQFTGTYDLQIDANGDGDYADPQDRVVTIGVPSTHTGSYSYTFDGRDGPGAPIDSCTPVNARLHFTRIGEIHFVNGDVENRAGGIELTRLNGAGAGDKTIRWNDTPIPAAGKTSTTPTVNGSAGVNSAGGVHSWSGTGADPWGNNAAVDDWTYVSGDQTTGDIHLAGRCLGISKSSNYTTNMRPGDVVTYTVSAKNNGADAYTAVDPAVVLDDLTAGLDDANYRNDASANLPGAIGYVQPILGWTGALSPGQTITMTYTVQLKDGGDSTLRNVAWDGKTVTTTPACAPPGSDGRDPATGVPCAQDVQLLPRVRVVKTSNPASGTGLNARDVITYTLTYSNTGNAAGAVNSTDDLSGVFDGDATLLPGSLVSSLPGVIIPTLTGPTLEVTGSLPAATTATVTYQVVVGDDGARGDNILNNVVAGDPGDEGICGVPADCVTTNGVGELSFTKSVNPASGTTVAPGKQVTYTLRIENTGTADVGVDLVDNLAGVIDDAVVSAGPTVTPPGSLLVTSAPGGQYNLTGVLPAGAVATVTYTVTVNPDGQRGDDVLEDFLFPASDPKTVCNDGDTDCTVNYVSVVVASKSADPAGGMAVQDGQTITYTLRFTNTSTNAAAGQAAVAYTDYLFKVLDDAVLTSGPAAGIGLSAHIAGQQILVTGTLGSGQSATVVYSVTVKSYTQQGDHALSNVLAVTGGDPICAPGSGLCTEHDSPPPPPTVQTGLARTGLDITAAGTLGILALLLGGGAILHGRGRGRRMSWKR
jgi:uncharacterized repeat protein (TIGR01451 family)